MFSHRSQGMSIYVVHLSRRKEERGVKNKILSRDEVQLTKIRFTFQACVGLNLDPSVRDFSINL